MSGLGPVGRNPDTEVFFDGTAQGQFLLQGCPNRHFNRPQAEVCAECGSFDLEPVAASGGVKLVSWVVIPARPVEDEAPAPPIIPAIVEFDEGPWWWARLVGADPDGLAEGQPLRMTFEQPEGSEAIPVFTPIPG